VSPEKTEATDDVRTPYDARTPYDIEAPHESEGNTQG
jgi:hypothetical protein